MHESGVMNYKDTMYINGNQLDSAIKCFTKAIDLDSTQGYLFYQRSFCYDFKGNSTLSNEDIEKACKLKYLRSVDFLRNIKNREYSFFRIDTLFSDNKQNSVELVKNGGWHFSNLKTYEDLEKKYLNDENHAEYELQNSSIQKIQDNVERKVIPYNYQAKKDSVDRFNETSLTKVDTAILPEYIRKNINTFKEWIIE